MSKNQNTSDYAQKLFVKSATALQSGDLINAKKGFVALAKKLPQNATVSYNLGLCYQHLGQHDRAISSYLKSIKYSPEQIDALVNLGISHKALKQIDKAITASQSALKIDPNHPRALNLLGSIEAEKGEYASAKKYLKNSLKSQPDNIDATINLATLELNENKLSEAALIIDPLFSSNSKDKIISTLKARLLLSLKEYKDAAPIVLRLESEYPDDEDVLRLNLSYREALRDHFGAITIAEKLLETFPNDADVWNSLAGAYFQLDGIEKSKSFYEKAVGFDPHHPEYENNLGLAYSSMGDKENAEKHYRRSLELNPRHAEAYRSLATMKRFQSIDDPDAQAVISLWNEADLDEFTTIKLAFALGKIYDDCGLYEQAFAVYKTGNDLKFKESRIDLKAYFEHIDRIPMVFDRPPMNAATPPLKPKPIFILGMPRSGTTLVEQIISRHSQVTGCGELPCIEKAITRLEKKANPMRIYPDDFLSLESSEFDRESVEYLAWVNRLHNFESSFFTDKMPFNFVHTWLIRALFPESAIVHCRRHPLDVIISNYFQLYGSDISFVYNLKSLAKYYLRYHRSMNHWQELFGDKIYPVVYEMLVSDPENETKRLIEATHLPWEDGCLKQTSSDTAVRTASIWQVRQGIYTSSKERWRNYETQLQEAIKILADENIVDTEGNWLINDSD